MVKKNQHEKRLFLGLCNSLLIGLGQDQQLLCILGELAGGGSKTVAAGISVM